MAIKSFLSEGGFSVGSVGSTPVEVIDSSGNVTAQTISGTNLTLSGNLTVNGSTVTVNSTTTTVDDPIFTIGGDTAPASDDNKDRGIEFRWHNGTAAKVGFFGYDDSTGYFTFIPDATNSSEVFGGTQGDIQATNFRGNLIGNITGSTTISGTATLSSDLIVNGSSTFNNHVGIIRKQLTFSSSVGDPNHAIYNNYSNLDGEGSWDGMKINSYLGLRVRTGNASGATPTQSLEVTSAGTTIGGTLTVNGTSATVINSSGSSEVIVSRANSGSGATVTLKTGSTLKWYFGLRGLSDDHFYVQNEVGANTALKLDSSTSNATFTGLITTNGVYNSATGEGGINVNSTDPVVAFYNSSNTANKRRFQIRLADDRVYFRKLNDALNTYTTLSTLDMDGNLTVNGTGTNYIAGSLSLSQTSTGGYTLGQTGILQLGNTSNNYLFSQGTWNSNITSGIIAHCADNWEFAVHDNGSRVVSAFAFFGGSNNYFQFGRDIGWGVSNAAFAGSVGVGTTSPTSLVHIYGGYPHVTLQNPTSGSGVTMLFVDGTTVKHTIGHINSSSKLQFGTGGTGTGSTWNGSIAMTIDGSQNIGIGTTSPTYKLHVVGDARLGANGQRIWLYDDGNAHIHSTSAPLWINSDDSSGVYINNQNSGNVILTNTTAGSVGIGTTSPAVKFHVADNAAGIQQRISSSHANGTSLQFVSTSTNGRSMRIGHNFVSGAGEFAIYDDTAATSRVYISSAGNVGINTTSPSNRLDVNGSIRTNDWYYVDGSGFGMYNNATAMYFSTNANSRWNFSSGQSSIGLRLYSGGHNNTWRGHFYGDSTGQGFLDSADNWQMYVDSSSRLRVYSGIYNAEAGIRILNPGGAAYSTQTSLVTGAFKIRLPVDRFKSNTMMRMTVKIYQYSTGNSYEFEIGGYNYSDAGATWYNIFAEQKSDVATAPLQVRFGNDGTANCIWIGETNTAWSYPQVFVTEFQGGYSGTTSGWASGWSIAPVTTFDTVTHNRTASQVATANNIGTLINNAGNLTIGGTINIVGDANSGTPDLYFNNAGGFGSASGQVRAYAPNNSSLAYYWDASYVTYYNSIRVVDGSSNVKVYLDSSTGSSYFNGGNLGVGTTTPLKKLTVYNGTAVIHGETAGAASINESTYGLVIAPLIQRSSTVGNYYPGIAFNHLYQYSGQGTTTYNANAHGWIGLRLTDTTGTERSSLVFATKTGTGNPGLDLPAERMCIRHDGNVGIGATDPGHKLEVSGNVLATKVFVGTANASYDLYNNGTSYLNGAVTTGGALTVGTNLTVGSGGGVTGLTLTQNWRLRRENATTGDFILDESGVDKLRITSAGNATLAGSVTVGTSSKINWSSSAQFESPSNGVVTISSNNGSYPGYLNVGGIQSWDGVIALSIGTGTGHVTANADLTVTGNLIVNGTTTTVNSTTATVKDPIITLGGGNAGTAASSDDNKDRGIEFKWHNGTAAKTGFFGFDDSTGYLIFIPDATNTSEVFSGTLGDIQATNFRGNLIGNVTGNVSGTAGGETLATVTGRGATTSTAVTLSNTANHYAGHHYFDAFDTAGNHYPHYQAGSDGTGAIANIRVGQSGGTHKLFILNGKDGAISWNGNTVWHAGNDGSGSGLDADLLDGYNQDTANTASTIVRRDASGNFSAGTINATIFKDADDIAYYGDFAASVSSTAIKIRGSIDAREAENVTAQNQIYLQPYNGASGTGGGGAGGTTGGSNSQGTGITWKPLYTTGTTYTKRSAGILQIGEGNYFRSGLAFYVNNVTDATTDWSEAMRIASNGYVGIGISAPSAKFHVSGGRTYLASSDGYELAFARSGSYFYFYNDGNGSTGKLSLTDTIGINNPIITFTQDTRNVGIGTTSPAHKLHILSSAGQDGINIDAVTYPEIVLYRNSVVKAYIGIAGNAGGYTVSPGSLADSLVVRSENAIHLAPAAGGYVSLTAATNGNVGIGTTSPSSKLHVQEVGTDGTPAIRITTTSAPSTFSWATSAINSSLTAGKNYIHLIGQAESSNNSGYIGFNYQGAGSTSNFVTIGHYGNNNLLNITAAGNVGIGTTSPSVKLHVAGSTIVANNTSINPDSYLNQVIAGAISTGSWGVSSAIGGSGNTGHAWAIGTNSTRLYFAYGDGASANTLQSFIEVNTNRNMTLMPTSGSIGVGTASPSYKLHVAGDIYCSAGAIRINATNPFYFETYGGGWFMQDTTWIRSYNAKSVWTGSGIIANDGGISVGYGGSTPPSGGVVISGSVGIGLGNGVNPTYKLEVNGSFAATTKSFVIPHPTKPGKRLRYGSLEGPENGVYVRGRLKGSNTIELPDYWEKLVDPDSITVNLTPIGKHQKLYVDSVSYKRVIVEKEGLFSGEIDCYYTIFAERIDVEKLQVEVDAK